MLRILAWAASILGVILLLLLALVFLLLMTRVRVEIDKVQTGPLRLAVVYGPLRIPILPLRKKPGKPQKPKPPPPAEKPEKKKSKFNLKEIDIGDTICLALDLLLELKNRLVIHRLRADVMIATGDAAKTGILLGRVAAISGMILPLLEQNFVIKDFHIDVDGDFQAESPATRAALGITFSLRPIHLPLIALKYFRRLLALFRSLKKALASSGEQPADPTIDPRNNPNNDTQKENAA